MKLQNPYDLVVIGGGSAGHAAASKAAELGLNCALIESADVLGGLCIRHGCMPSKALIETANRLREIRYSAEFGIRVGEALLDVDVLRDRVSTLISGFREEREDEMLHARYQLLRGQARFTSLHDLSYTDQFGDSRTLHSSSFIIATGSRPVIPEIPGLQGTPFWTSNDAVALPFLPGHLVILGAGAIGMECAHLYEGLGSHVTVIARGAHLLPHHDPDLSQALEAESKERGIDIRTQANVLGISHHDGVFTIQLEGAEAITADALLLATGRAPNTQNLGLEGIGIIRDHGRILIDERCATSRKHIFAAGDCASPLSVVHLAVFQGEVAAKNAFRLIREGHENSPAEWNRETMMAAWFTEPQSIEIGLSVKEALRNGIPIVTGRQDYAYQGKGIIAGSKHGFVKVIAHAETRKLMGAVGIGPAVAETGHILAFAIERGLTAEEYLTLPHYHPTFAEAWSRAVENLTT